MVPAREMYPVNEAAILLGLSKRSVWYLVERDEIEWVRHRTKTLIPRTAIIEFVDQLRRDRIAARAKAEAEAGVA